jgi:hypothetical protein
VTPRALRRRAALGLATGLVLALGLSACAGGETTVTVTRTVDSSGKQNGSGKPVGPLEEGVVAGYADQVKVEGETMVLTGWASSPDFSEPASQVAAVVDGKALAEVVPTLNRSDVVEALGKPGLEDSGFELQLPLAELDCGAPAAGVEVVAELNGKSGPLEYGEGVKKAVSDAC